MKDMLLNVKWIQSTLKLSFPKVKKIVSNLVESGYLIPVRSTKDKRVVDLLPSKKLKEGVVLFEKMKMNELHKLGFSTEEAIDTPALSQLNNNSVNTIKEKFLKEFLD